MTTPAKGQPITKTSQWLKKLRQKFWKGQSSDEIYDSLQKLLFAKFYAESNNRPFHLDNFDTIYTEAREDYQVRTGIDMGPLPKAVTDSPDDYGEAIKMIGAAQVSSDRNIWHVINNLWTSKSMRKEDGQYFTPYAIKLFMCMVYRPTRESKICDPCGGSGGFLIMAADLLRSIDPSLFYYNDSDRERIAKVAQLAFATYRHRSTGQDLAHIHCSTNDALDGPWPNTMDRIYTNVPFGQKVSARKILDQYEMGRNKASELTQLLFIEKCIKQLEPNGLLATVVDKGIVTNRKHERERAKLASMAALELVVELPGVAFEHFAGTTFPTYLLFFRKGAPVLTRYEKVNDIGYDANGYNIRDVGEGPCDPFDSCLELENYKSCDLHEIERRWRNREWPERPDPGHDYPYDTTLTGDWMWGYWKRQGSQSRRLSDIATMLKEPWDGRNTRNPTVDRKFRLVKDTHLNPKAESKTRTLRKGCLLFSRILSDSQVPACGLISEPYDGAGCTNENYIIDTGNTDDLCTIWFLMNFDADCHDYLRSHCRGQGRGRIMEDDLLAMPIRRLTKDEMQKSKRLLERLEKKGKVDILLFRSIKELSAIGDARE